MKRIRVLHIITHLAVGGALDNTLLTVKGLPRERYQVDLAAGPLPEGEGYSDWKERSRESADKLITIPSLQRSIRPQHDWRAYRQLLELIQQQDYDVVHTHCSKAGVLGRMAARKAKSPVIIHTAHAFGSQVIRASNESSIWKLGARLKEKFFITAERYAGSISDCTITVCKQNKQQAIEQKLAKPHKITTIYSGIDLERFNAHADRKEMFEVLGFDPNRPLVAFIGRLAEQKAPLDFVMAAKQVLQQCPEAQFVIAGDGPLTNSVLFAIRDEPRIQYIGFFEQIPELMSVTDILAVSSLWEGLGRSVTEAMIMGVPVAATAVDGIPELITHEQTGLLSAPHNTAGLANNIVRLLTNPAEARTMAQKAQKRVDTEFSAERMVQRIDELYQQLLRDKGLLPLDFSQKTPLSSQETVTTL